MNTSTLRVSPWTAIVSQVLGAVGTWMLARPKRGSLTVVFPDGSARRIYGNEAGENAVLRLRNFGVLSKSIERGMLGFAASYMDGDIEVDDLTALFRFFLQNETTFKAAGKGLFRRARRDKTYHESRPNTLAGSRRNISEHYDLGNEFYSHWLDASMTYSAGLFSHGEQSREDAQAAKYRRIVELAGIRPGSSVLEIGCGWGGFSEVAARDHGATVRAITLSAPQLIHTRRRLEQAGLSNSAIAVLEDYRETAGTFDHVVSIEMIEAVGEQNWPSYFEMLRDRLTPGGTAAIQAITIREDRLDEYRAKPDFIQRYIFPGGMLPTRAIMSDMGRRFGLQLEEVQLFGTSYARTLMLWRRRFLEKWSQIAALGFDRTFKRKWLYYLSYCEAGFAENNVDVGIYRFRKVSG